MKNREGKRKKYAKKEEKTHVLKRAIIKEDTEREEKQF